MLFFFFFASKAQTYAAIEFGGKDSMVSLFLLLCSQENLVQNGVKVVQSPTNKNPVKLEMYIQKANMLPFVSANRGWKLSNLSRLVTRQGLDDKLDKF